MLFNAGIFAQKANAEEGESTTEDTAAATSDSGSGKSAFQEDAAQKDAVQKDAVQQDTAKETESGATALNVQSDESDTEGQSEGESGESDDPEGNTTESDESGESDDPEGEGNTEGEGGEDTTDPMPTEPTIAFNEATSTLTIGGPLDIDKDLLKNYKNSAKHVVVNIDGSVGVDTFREWKTLEDISITCTGTIGGYAVWNTSVNTIVVGKAESIANYAFGYNANLTDVSISNVDTVAGNLFYVADKCPNLANASFSNIKTLGNVLQSRKSLKTLSLDTVDYIVRDAFASCINLQSVDLSSVKELGQSAFSYCNGLTEITLDNIKLGPTTFYGCAGLESATISNVALIPTNTFYNCNKLETVNITNVNTIGQYAFSCNVGLTTVTMNGVDAIDDCAFWECSNLKTVIGLDTVKNRIGGFAFYGCEKLENLTVADAAKMGFIGNHEGIMERVQAILAGQFKLDPATEITSLTREGAWTVGKIGRSENWKTYDNGTQIMQQARWSEEADDVAEVKVDAYYTGKKQMDYIFVVDVSGSMAYLGNPDDNNARFYDMQSKLLSMTGQLLTAADFDCQVAVVAFGGAKDKVLAPSSSGFVSNADEMGDFIKKLEPRNEYTDYGLGMQKAQELIASHADRNTVVVFMSDGAPNVGASGDQSGEKAATAIKEAGVPIYGVLHSPTAGEYSKALDNLKAVCSESNDDSLTVFESIDTDSFSKAMNKAVTAVYGDNTVTVPVNSTDFVISDIKVTTGKYTYDADQGVIEWSIEGMPFTQHSLTYNMTLKSDLANRVGTYTYTMNNDAVNNGEAAFDVKGGASTNNALTALVLNRTVSDPGQGGDKGYDTTVTNPGSDVPVTNPGGGAPVANPGNAALTPIGAGAGATPALIAPAVPVVPVAPAAAPAADATVIPDNANPMAQNAGGNDEMTIADDGVPMAAFDNIQPWTQYLFYAGMILTVLYGFLVVARREREKKEVDALENQVLGMSR